MAISLYDATVANYIQTATAVGGFLDRGLAHCADNGVDPDSLVETRLFDDMLPLRFQIVAVHHHSVDAIEGVKTGVFGPPTDQRQHDYAGLQALVAETLEALKALTRDEVDATQGKDVVFKMRSLEMPFVAENFLFSFSLPNFYFHAATAYDILRSKGVPLGKRDFMGPVRMKA
ncbi:MAG TPA: DUF1993 domain-containing protein [Caulobacteraceae bacterium]|jgi:hypothetical protein|nr:DUF1993 domain-containing protein [Caulobacteraceae bacterium]